jgi:hypothetical protein
LEAAPVKFIQDDAGRAKSKRPKQRNDCTVRALSTILTRPYDEVFDLLADAGRKSSKPFDLEAWARKNTIVDGAGYQRYFWLDKMPYTKPKAGPGTRYRIWDFLKDRSTGPYIVSSASHVFAVYGGEMHDDTPWHYAENRPVYGWLSLMYVYEKLWRVYAMRRPIKKGSPMFKRSVAIVEGRTESEALRQASRLYEWAIRPNEDLTVEPHLT